MPRVTLSGGRWIDMRPLYVSDRLAIVDLNQRSRDMAPLDTLRELGAIIEAASLGKSWEGPLLAMSERELLGFVRAWDKASEDDAVPPVSGAPSRKRSPKRGSAEPTESQSAPGGPTS